MYCHISREPRFNVKLHSYTESPFHNVPKLPVSKFTSIILGRTQSEIKNLYIKKSLQIQLVSTSKNNKLAKLEF